MCTWRAHPLIGQRHARAEPPRPPTAPQPPLTDEAERSSPSERDSDVAGAQERLTCATAVTGVGAVPWPNPAGGGTRRGVGQARQRARPGRRPGQSRRGNGRQARQAAPAPAQPGLPGHRAGVPADQPDSAIAGRAGTGRRAQPDAARTRARQLHPSRPAAPRCATCRPCRRCGLPPTASQPGVARSPPGSRPGLPDCPTLMSDLACAEAPGTCPTRRLHSPPPA